MSEKDLLLPQLRNRVVYMRECFERIKAIAVAPETSYRLAHVLRELVPPELEPDPIGAYLGGVARICEDTFIEPLLRLEDESSSISTVPQFLRFMNSLRFICDIVIGTENLLFRYRARVVLHAVDKVSGKTVEGEEYEKNLDIALIPFASVLGELKRTAESTEGSIDHWVKQQEAAKKPFLEYAAAATNAETSRRTIWVQMLAIMISLSFSSCFLTARDPFNLKRENTALKFEIQEAKDEAARLAAELARLRARPAQGMQPTP
ncbi:hypothetical protein [Pyxidicoccus xibeiensis]|uniref:hypothetical protein n=1 Tax=Pyxidicoccus xibeiensis TaxID=2906759 RepID=UPI0020A7FDC5|nr:hypothetical protein [Pyxidicoccus xibeiensis]MCP3142319.1 hypothetical protein [Pyxidicoccus xibeiensis]